MAGQVVELQVLVAANRLGRHSFSICPADSKSLDLCMPLFRWAGGRRAGGRAQGAGVATGPALLRWRHAACAAGVTRCTAGAQGAGQRGRGEGKGAAGNAAGALGAGSCAPAPARPAPQPAPLLPQLRRADGKGRFWYLNPWSANTVAANATKTNCNAAAGVMCLNYTRADGFAGSPVYAVKYKLPQGFTCDRCILHWWAGRRGPAPAAAARCAAARCAAGCCRCLARAHGGGGATQQLGAQPPPGPPACPQVLDGGQHLQRPLPARRRAVPQLQAALLHQGLAPGGQVLAGHLRPGAQRQLPSCILLQWWPCPLGGHDAQHQRPHGTAGAGSAATPAAPAQLLTQLPRLLCRPQEGVAPPEEYFNCAGGPLLPGAAAAACRQRLPVACAAAQRRRAA